MKLMNMNPAQKIAAVMTRLYNSKLTTTSGGNLSIMDENGTLWISPSGVDKAHLTEEDIMSVTPDGVVHGKHRPSTEYPFHLAVLRSRPDLKAVLHAHPAALVAYSLERKLPDMDMFPGVASLCGKIAIAKYALPGSTRLGDLISAEFAAGCDTVLLENHGVVLGADSLERAFQMFEALDFSARTGIAASMLHRDVRHLSADSLALKNAVPSYEAVLEADEDPVREDIVDKAVRCCGHHLFTAATGVYASRTKGGFIVTPAGEDRARLTPDMLVRVEGDKCEKGKVPSPLSPIISDIFKAHADIESIVIARPPYIMGFAVTDAEFNSHMIPEGYICLKNAVRHGYGCIENNPEEIVDSISMKNPIAIIENDCVIVAGTSPLNAYDRLEVLEFGAESLCDIASMNGTIVPISEEEIREIEVAFNL
ncbi:MAG: class II aldolase/adducin family protein [Clostridia bacterium]|nr:class II aldolase/adducin family protein [Clostridia bacterium]